MYFAVRSCDSNDGSCDVVLEAMLEGLNKWDGITMEISQIDYHHSYKLLSTLLELASLLLEVCAGCAYVLAHKKWTLWCILTSSCT